MVAYSIRFSASPSLNYTLIWVSHRQGACNGVSKYTAVCTASKVSARSPLGCQIGDIFCQIGDILRERRRKTPNLGVIIFEYIYLESMSGRFLTFADLYPLTRCFARILIKNTYYFKLTYLFVTE